MKVPRIRHERVEDDRVIFNDAEEGFQIMPLELVRAYNRMAETLELLHGYWALVVDIAWDAHGDKTAFEHTMHEAMRRE